MNTAQNKPNITVRDCTARDMDAVQRIYAHHVENGVSSFEETAPDVEEMTRRREKVLEKNWPFIVAEADGVVMGYAYVSSFRPRSAYRHTVENSVYVEPEATGQGFGTSLLSELIERCTELGYRQMVAVIGGGTNTASMALHERFGFHHVGTLNSTGFKIGRWVDTVIMQRALGVGDTTLPK